jgi:hypothetical protein
MVKAVSTQNCDTSSVIFFQGTIMECDQQLAYLHGYSSSDELVNMNVRQLIPSLALPTSGQSIDKVRIPTQFVGRGE